MAVAHSLVGAVMKDERFLRETCRSKKWRQCATRRENDE
jgi:hypothetical protein